MKLNINTKTLIVQLFLLLITSCTKYDPATYHNMIGVGPRNNEVWMENTTFMPYSKTVLKGTTITWINKDVASHTVTSTTDLFDSEQLKNSKSFSYTFNSAGTYPYYCKDHAEMTGIIIVQ